MSSESLELVRSIYADWERGDFSRTDWADPEIEYVVADGPSPGQWNGLTGLTRGSREILSAWHGARFEVHDFRALDSERVLVFMRYLGRGRTSGLDSGLLQTEGAHLFHVRSGKITRLVAYLDRDRAFADLGLTLKEDAG